MGEGTFYEGIQEKSGVRTRYFPQGEPTPPNKLLARMNAGIESFVGFFIVGDIIQNDIKGFVVFLPCM